MAMWGNNGVVYATYSKCTYNAQGNFHQQLTRVYSSAQGTALVNRLNIPKCDQHQAAAIRVASNGYIHLHQSARGDWYPSRYWISKKPYDITEWREVETDQTNYRAYPQTWSMGLLYTKYNGSLRELYVKANSCEKKLVNGGHYAVSHYDGKFIHMAYNHHHNGDLNQRQNVYYMRSANGCDWQNAAGQSLTLPLESDSPLTRIIDTGSNLVFMKDIDVINDEVHIAYVNSTSWDPLHGYRTINIAKLDNTDIQVDTTCHNYNAGNFLGDRLVFPKCGEPGYAGGNMHFYELDGTHKGSRVYDGKVNFISKIVTSVNQAYPKTGFFFSLTESSIGDMKDNNFDHKAYIMK